MISVRMLALCALLSINFTITASDPGQSEKTADENAFSIRLHHESAFPGRRNDSFNVAVLIDRTSSVENLRTVSLSPSKKPSRTNIFTNEQRRAGSPAEVDEAEKALYNLHCKICKTD